MWVRVGSPGITRHQTVPCPLSVRPPALYAVSLCSMSVRSMLCASVRALSLCALYAVSLCSMSVRCMLCASVRPLSLCALCGVSLCSMLCALCSVRLSVPRRSVRSVVCWCSALCRLGTRVNTVSFRAVWRCVGPRVHALFVCTHVQRGLFTPVTFEACLASARREMSEYGFLCARDNYHCLFSLFPDSTSALPTGIW